MTNIYAYATKITRNRGHDRDMTNRKPFRTQEQKELARKTAKKGEDGAWRSNAPVSYHYVTSGKYSGMALED